MIRNVFSLVAHDNKDRVFKLCRLFCNLHGAVGKYIILSLGGTKQQFIAFKFEYSAPTPLVHVFTQSLVSIRFQVHAVVLFKGINAEM